MGIFDLIKKVAPAQRNDGKTALETSSVIPINHDEIMQNETYTHYGTRICATVNASIASLPAFLQKVYLYEKNRQANNEELQEGLKKEKKLNIAQLDTDIANIKTELEGKNRQIEDCNANISSINQQIAGIKQNDNNDNKEFKLRMNLGLIILIPLTIYLFLFYSSTFYSAFFRNFTDGKNIGIETAMFDSQALPNAFNDGLGELMFVLFAPIIFLGLGFTLHIFSKAQGVAKYLKTGAVILVTFVFDCILAYSIAKAIYEVNQLINLEYSSDAYSLSYAISDNHVWAVIFCGFVAYIIWGLVFDMTMDAYDKRISNKAEIEKQNLLLAAEKDKKNLLNNEITILKKKISNKEGEREKLNIELTTNTIYTYDTSIKTCMADFFTGWLKGMATLECPKELQEQATSIYNNTKSNLFVNKNSEITAKP